MSSAPTPTKRSSYFNPISFEADAAFLPVLGELPEGLQGTLYRTGPNPQFPLENAHLFFGDGMLHAFTLHEGRASYRNRWIRTNAWQAEHAAGRRLYNAAGRPINPEDPALPAEDNGTGNTHVIGHAGRLFALEEAHLPIEIDAATLRTLGSADFGGKLKGPFTAHPHVDPATGEMLFFGYGAGGYFTPDISFGTMNAAGEVTRFDRFIAPFSSMVHDFAITEHHMVFPVLPLTGSMERASSGRPPFAWEPELGARVGILPRNAPASDIRWFEGKACYIFHFMNAWEERDAQGHRLLKADVLQFEQPPLFPFADGRPTDTLRSMARLVRWTFDLDGTSNTFRQEPLDDLLGEFPRMDDRFTGRAHRHGWYACQREGATQPSYDGVAHHDTIQGRRAVYHVPQGDRLSEPVFVPRDADAPEGEGWVLAVAARMQEGRSDLLVLDAQDIASGPVATVQLSHRVPGGFHGSWIPGAALNLGDD
ncbi:carotenoid oxygenase family protein [Variovorax sp. Sphag1AA]|uniref:carotenoid oxygenase family protein n=1 Tax=Variovorax sp. Sphag1AA TaxID=2587027 RepID=UPI00160B1FA3|nr:carotenoid oxygenase family protein [Variovorax sp. Sphag1AA]MBB3181499.1 carotenoid cleavage dioxygenase [Variovorax sp. Sphag1AA]